MFERACASDVSGLRHWRISLKMNPTYFWYNYTIINCLLTTFVHKYYAQPIYYTDVSKRCESLTEYPFKVRVPAPGFYFFI